MTCVFYYYSNRLQNPWVNPFVYGFAFFISGHHHYFSFVLISFTPARSSVLSPPLAISLGPSLYLHPVPSFSLACALSFSPTHSHTLFHYFFSLVLFPLLALSLFLVFLSLFLFLFFLFLMLSFLISILENFQTLHMNWALPYKCVRIYTEAHTLRDFGSLKGPREILLKRNKFRADSWKHPRNEHILIIPEILCSIPCGLPLKFMRNRSAYNMGYGFIVP